MTSSAEDCVYTSLFLLSLALRPLPDGSTPAFIQLDRSDVWRLAVAAGVLVGRNRFHAAAAALATETDTALAVIGRRGNRRSLRIERPASDAYGWTEEVLDALGFDDLAAAIEAATAHGFDTTTALPADVLQDLPPADEDDAEDDDQDEDAEPAQTCTKCHEQKTVDAFAVRSNGRLSSWCRACTNAASRTWRQANPGRTYYSPPSYPQRTWAEVLGAQPRQKLCRGCRTMKPSGLFGTDRWRSDGLASRCRSCRANARSTS